MPASPSIQNYRIPSGILSIKKPGESDYVHAGNVINFRYEPTVEKLEHRSKLTTGISAKDRTDIIQTAATVSFVLDEVTARNLAFFMLGEVDTGTGDNEIVTPLTDPDQTVDVKVIANNPKGPQLDFYGNLTLSPSGEFSLVTEDNEYVQMEITGDVNLAAALFGEGDKFGEFVVRPPA